MQECFEIESPNENNNLVKIECETINFDNFCMHLYFGDEQISEGLGNRLISLKRTDEADADTEAKLNFNIDCISNKILLSGNLFNALNMLKEYRFISESLYVDILAHGNFKKIIYASQSYFLPENRQIQNDSDSAEEASDNHNPYSFYPHLSPQDKKIPSANKPNAHFEQDKDGCLVLKMNIKGNISAILEHDDLAEKLLGVFLSEINEKNAWLDMK